MPTKTREVLQQALRLPPEERARVARGIISSLEPEGDADVEIAWQKEISRRLAEVKSGSVKLVPWETVLRRARSKIRAAS